MHNPKILEMTVWGCLCLHATIGVGACELASFELNMCEPLHAEVV